MVWSKMSFAAASAWSHLATSSGGRGGFGGLAFDDGPGVSDPKVLTDQERPGLVVDGALEFVDVGQPDRRGRWWTWRRRR